MLMLPILRGTKDEFVDRGWGETGEGDYITRLEGIKVKSSNIGCATCIWKH